MPNSQEQKNLIDEGAIATGVAKKLIDRLLDHAEQSVKDWWAQKKNTNRENLTEYIAAQYKRYSKIKNILYDTEPINIQTIYVPTTLLRDEHSYDERKFIADLEQNRRSIITATAGAGKSFLMRHMFIHFATNQTKYMPLFFELRNINERKQSSLVGHIYQQTKIFCKDLMIEQLTFGLEKGLFVVLLDGFDEIDPDKIEEAQKQILEFSLTYPKAPIAVSSRPHDAVTSWQEFMVYSIAPLSKEGVKRLVDKLRFDPAVKSKFITEIDQGLYKRHKSFLSVPLLATMMLLTFSETAEIENKLHAFYSDAFNALFYRHDAKKDAFRRPLASKLSREQFRVLFSAFCVLSYSDRSHQFDEEAALKVIGRASKLQSITVDPRGFLQDLIVGVCMLIRDGHKFIFSHRSFQEYFSALFIDSCCREDGVRIIDELAPRMVYDQTLRLLLGINPELVEVDWVLPRAKRVGAKLGKVDVSKEPDRLMKLLYRLRVVYDPKTKVPRSVGYSLNPPVGTIVTLIMSLYDEVFSHSIGVELFTVFPGPEAWSPRGSAFIDFTKHRGEFLAHASLVERLGDLKRRIIELPSEILARYGTRSRRLEELLLR